MIDSTSNFGGPIHSLSLSPAASTLAVGYGEDVSLAKMKSNPYSLAEDRELLPKPTPHPQPSSGRALQPVAMSLHFLGKKNKLIVTYLNYGIVWVPLPIATEPS